MLQTKVTGINKLRFFVQLVYLRHYEHHTKSKLKCHMHLLYRRVE